jgi:enamine deaminase RidA (YjgF/YER057c/UK114 family)
VATGTPLSLVPSLPEPERARLALGLAGARRAGGLSPHLYPCHHRDRNQDGFIAGQEPEDAQGNLVGPSDLAAQASQVFANLGRALAAADARPEQVAKITIYVVHHRPEYLPVIEQARPGPFGDHKSADTVVGEETLARFEYLIEVDAIAVTDG